MGDSCFFQAQDINPPSQKQRPPSLSSSSSPFSDQEELKVVINCSSDPEKMLRKSIPPHPHDRAVYAGRLAINEGLAKTTEDAEILARKSKISDDRGGSSPPPAWRDSSTALQTEAKVSATAAQQPAAKSPAVLQTATKILQVEKEVQEAAAWASPAKINSTRPVASETTQLLHDPLRNRPLTVFMAIRGILALIVLVTTSFTLLVFLAPVGFGILRLFSIHFTREISAFVFGHWLSMWPILIERINGTKMVFAGERVPKGERVLVLCNHRTEVDWMYVWNLALRKDRIGYVKYMLKSSVRNLPIFGWGFHVLEFLFLDRNWQIDEPVIKSYASSFKDPSDPLWLILFPEGTDFTEAKKVKSQQFAELHGLKKLNNVLLPRTKGFVACLSNLRTSVDAAMRWRFVWKNHHKLEKFLQFPLFFQYHGIVSCFQIMLYSSLLWSKVLTFIISCHCLLPRFYISVYDLTIGYKHRCPTFYDNLFGVDPPEVHIHVRRIPITQIPVAEDRATTWLQELFYRKDRLLDVFNKEGSFPNSGVESNLDIQSCSKKILVLLVFTVALLALAIFSSNWVKVYVVFSCVYLTIVTYFNCKPTPFFTRGE